MNTRDVCPANIQKRCKSEGKICNPKTRQCVVSGGGRGRQLLANAHYVKHHDVHHVRHDVPNALHKHIRGLKTKFPADIDREVKKTLHNIEDFEHLYEEEHGHLEHNVKNGHKRGVLSRMFYAAKNSLMGLLRLIKKHPAFAILIIGAILYGATAMYAPQAIQTALGYVTLPEGMTASQFVEKYWQAAKNYVESHGGSSFMATMRSFTDQLVKIRGHLSGWWSTLTGAIVEAWRALSKYVLTTFGYGHVVAQSPLSQFESPASPFVLSPSGFVHQNILPAQSSWMGTAKGFGKQVAVSSGISAGISTLGSLFSRKRPSVPPHSVTDYEKYLRGRTNLTPAQIEAHLKELHR
jgi:hypothetical protein